MKLKALADQVIVITGASSGIGLATALAAAKKGARLVLVARNGDTLKEIERQINAGGGQALGVEADVSRLDDVRKIADAAKQRFGGFDTWVNDAGVGLYGKIEDAAIDDARQLFDTNFWGMVYGSLEAVEHLKAKGGALINLGSVASDMPLALHGIYCASKHAVKGFTDTLRLELRAEKSPLSVTLIKPASIGTPFFTHAKNYTRAAYEATPPVYAPEEVANAVLYAAMHRIRDIYVGSSAPIVTGLQRLMPSLMDWFQGKDLGENAPGFAPHAQDGSLYAAGDDGKVHEGAAGGISIYTRAKTNPAVTGAAMAALAAAGVLAAYAAMKPAKGLRKYLP